MSVFRFRLNFLIALRKQREEEAAVKLARRLASIAELLETIEATRLKIAEMTEAVKSHAQLGRLTGPLIKLYSDFQANLQKELKKNEELLALSRREEAKERLALTKAVVARQLIEKTKERRQEAFEIEARYEEQKNLEELSTAARIRRLEEMGLNNGDNQTK
ncbi:MAG: hypothetical protein LBT38_08085 [Deltaproteobacteria bacterium]|jgi:flagellar export protein FliJ|nr:hypothetical protein [Deltaproteobacteria bacterium]